MDASWATRPYLPDRIAACLLALGYTASMGVALNAQQQLSTLMPSHHAPVGLTTAVLTLVSFAAHFWAAYGLFRGQRWAFMFLALVELGRLVNFIGNFWSLSPGDRASGGGYLVIIPVGTAFSIGTLAYGFVRVAGLFGPPLPLENAPKPIGLDRLVGTAMVFGSLAAGLLEIGAIYQWSHRADAIRYFAEEPLLSKINPYATILLWRLTTVWISASVSRGYRWAFILAAIFAFAALLPLLLGSHNLHPVAVACYLAVLGYCGFRLSTIRSNPFLAR